MSRLAAWSRRKAQRRAEEEALRRQGRAGGPVASEKAGASEKAAATGAPVAEAPDPARHDGMSDSEILARLGLPHPESLGPGDDFGAFLRAEVPEHLKRLALRRLWRSDPVLANLDSLVDYGEDFTLSGKAGEAVRTAWRHGRGLLAEAPDGAEADGARADAPDMRRAAAGMAEGEEEETEAAGMHPAAADTAHVAEGRMERPNDGVAREGMSAEPARRDAGGRRRLKFSFSETAEGDARG